MSESSEFDPRLLRRRLDATALERLRIGSIGAVAFAILGVGYFWFADAESASVLSIVTGLLGAVAAAIRLAVTRDMVPERWASTIGSALWSGGVTITALAFALTGSGIYIVFAAVLVLSAGMLHLFTCWVVVCCLYSLAVWLPVGFVTAGSEFVMHAVVLVAVWVLAIMAHVLAIRYFIDLEALRFRDRAHQEERERLHEQLLHSQKHEAVGTLAGGVAHDMNNMLAAIVGLAEIVREEVTGSARDDIDQILDSAQRGAELTRNLLGFSRRGNYQSAPFAMQPMVASVVKLLQRTLPKGISVVAVVDAEHYVVGDSGQLSHAVMNLCLNSADAMDGAGVLRIEVGEIELDTERARALAVQPGRYVTVAVTDDGCGMSDDVAARAFDPFFTTKPQGRGTGLGLAMVYGTSKRHDGAVSIDSEVGRGTTITMFLPATAAIALAKPPLPLPHVRGMGRIMIVDDEPVIRSNTARCLQRRGYEVVCFANGAEAVEDFARRAREIDVVILDMAMPVMDGAECFRRLKALDPAVRVIIASGYAREGDAQRCLDGGALTFLEKPFHTRALVDAIAQAMRDAPLPARHPPHAFAYRPTSSCDG